MSHMKIPLTLLAVIFTSTFWYALWRSVIAESMSPSEAGWAIGCTISLGITASIVCISWEEKRR